jgi:hypothetical protein
VSDNDQQDQEQADAGATTAVADRARPAAKAARRAPAPTTPTRITTTYEDPREWLDELRMEAPDVERGVVRACVRESPPGGNVGMKQIDVVAGYVCDGQIRELVHGAGVDWNTGADEDLATRERRDALVREIRATCADLGLELRGGRFGLL